MLSTSEKVEIFPISNRGFNMFSNNTQLLEIQLLQIFPYIFFIFCTVFCSLYLRIYLADKMYLLLYWGTNDVQGDLFSKGFAA